MPGPPPNPPRDGDKKQARQRVNVLVRTGRMPHPNDVPCADCGHVWREGEPRHEYDHHRGYAAAHHYDVQSLCTACHTVRTDVPAPAWATYLFAPWKENGFPYRDSHWSPPRTWERQAVAAGSRRRVYVAPGVDPFDVPVPDAARSSALAKLFRLVEETRHLDWLLVTEHPEHATALAAALAGWEEGWPRNAWLGTTVEVAEDLTKVSRLLAIGDPWVRFVKYEPAREFVAFPAYLKRLDWLIVGGDSGIDRRSPFDPRWAKRADVDCSDRALFVSQDGGATFGTQGRIPDSVWQRKEFPSR